MTFRALSGSTASRRRLLGLASVALAVGLVAGGASAAERQHLEIATAKGTQVFRVEVVDDDASRAKGLMFRTEMGADEGMLFDFRREEPVAFWMKNTYLPLDMIFIRANGEIRSIAADATPLSETPIGSGGPVRFVLELNAGTAAKLGIVPGAVVTHARIHR